MLLFACRSSSSVLVSLLSITFASAAAGATTYKVQAIAPDDTRYLYTNNLAFTPANQLVGQSRIDPYEHEFGSLAWRFDGESLIPMGLAGTAYAEPTGKVHSSLPTIINPYEPISFRWHVPQFTTATGLVMGFNSTVSIDSWGDLHSWVDDGAGTRRVGQPDPQRFPNAVTDDQWALALNDDGIVMGRSDLNTDPSAIFDAGRYLWRDDRSQMTILGLLDDEHLSADGLPYAYISTQIPSSNRMNASGSVIGDSRRFKANGEYLSAQQGYAGASAWVYDASTAAITRLGFTDAVHTRVDGHQRSVVGVLNDQGQVVGQSFQFTGSWVTGYSMWRYQGDTTEMITVPAAAGDGLQSNVLYDMNQQGDITLANVVLASPQRVAAPQSVDSAVPWLIRDGTAIQLGLRGTEHLKNNGESLGVPTLLSPAGVVAGLQARYDPVSGERMGTSAWTYADGQILEIGFPARYPFNEVKNINASGQIVGFSNDASFLDFDPLESVKGVLLDGYMELGRTERTMSLPAPLVWFYDGESTFAIELQGQGFECGHDNLSIEALNDQGFVLGSAFYCNFTADNRTRRGLKTAWIYDSSSDRVHELTLARNSYGQGETRVYQMSAEGHAVGSYVQFDTSDVASEDYAFVFTPDAGMRDLATVVGEEAMAAAGIVRLLRATAINSVGEIAVEAEANDGRIVAVLLTPKDVVEPPVIEPPTVEPPTVEPPEEALEQPEESRWSWLRPLLGERLYQIVVAWLSQRDQQ